MTSLIRFPFLLALALAVVVPAAAQILETAESSDSFGEVVATGDFDGDGFDDLAIGAPFEDLGTLGDAGLVHVIYGTATGLADTGNEIWTQDSPGIIDAAETGDRFGRALAAGDFDGDGFDDLAIGTPGEGFILSGGSTVSGAGAVNVLYGSSSGLSSRDQFWHQGSPGISLALESGDSFGAALTVGDFNSDGRDDLAIGVPLEDLGTVMDAGFVHVLYGTTGGLTTTGAQTWDQDSPGVGSTVEEDDQFGFSLTSGDFNGDGFDELAIGAPFEGTTLGGGIPEVGQVSILNGTPSGLTGTGGQTWYQSAGGPINNPQSPYDHFGWSLAAGDFDGDGRDDLAFGVPFEDFGGFADSGIVHVLYGTASGLDTPGGQGWHQNVAGVSSTVEAGDVFGYSLATGDFDGNGRDDLVIGVPGEDENAGPPSNIGVAHVLYGSSGSGLSATGEDFWHQDAGTLKEVAETGDFFGWAVGAGDFDNDGRDDLTIGAPYEDLDAISDVGVAHTLYGTGSGLTDDGNQLWYQGAAAPVTVALPAGPFTVARRQTLSYSATFTTGPNPPESFQYWTEATLPNGSVRGPFVGPNTLAMDPEQTVVLAFNQRVPNRAPLGDYTYTMQAGSFPNGVIAEDSFPVTVTASARLAAGETDLTDDAWLIYDGAGRLMEAGTMLDVRGMTQAEVDALVLGAPTTPQAASTTGLPEAPALHPAAPNPAAGRTTLRFDLSTAGPVRLAVYDALGREIAVLVDGMAEAGPHAVSFDARALPTGVYLVRLEAGSAVQTQRLTVVR